METQLIELYLLICTFYDNQPLLNQQRLSNFKPLFTDQELLTMYLFGHLQGFHSQRRIYDYFAAHWHAWFLALPSYQAFNRRLQLLLPAFELLIEANLHTAAQREALAAADRLIDSLPVMLAQGSRANRARVAREMGATALSIVEKPGDEWQIPFPKGWNLFAVAIAHRFQLGVLEPIRLDTDSPIAYYNLSVGYYVEAGRPGVHELVLQAAAEAFKKAVSLKEDYADAFNYLGNAYDGLHQYEDAVAAYKRATELAPKMAEPQNGLGLAYTALDRYLEAIEAFRKAIDLKPDCWGVYGNLAHAYHDSGNRKELQKLYWLKKERCPDGAKEVLWLQKKKENRHK